MNRELTCIGCPMGCRLIVTLDDAGKFVSVEGYTCLNGKKYAENEVTCPKRMVTSLVHVADSKVPLSVKTNVAIDKDKIFDCLDEIAKVNVKTPIHIGDVLIKGVCGTDVNVVAAKELV